MAKFDVVSDIHLDRLRGADEKGMAFIDSMLSEPQAPTLLVAGDVGFQNDFHAAYFFDQAKKKYDRVICVLGNHDYWGFDLKEVNPVEYWANIYKSDNISFLDLKNPTAIEVEDAVVVGGTLWSELDPTYEVLISMMLNDFKAIKKFELEDYKALYKQELENLKAQIANYKDSKLLVLTHHSPTFRNTGKWSESPIKSCFCTDLEGLIFDNPQIKAWVYGHCHQPGEVEVGVAKVLEHSFGYYNDKTNCEFKPRMVEI